MARKSLPVTAAVRVRLWGLIDPEPDEYGCHRWLGPYSDTGYGVTYIYPDGQKQTCSAHRLVYAAFVGDPDPELDVHHTCDRGPAGCVWPDHLIQLTTYENVMMGNGAGARNAKKTHCPHGHAYINDGVWVRDTRGRWSRTCSTCNDGWATVYKQRVSPAGLMFEYAAAECV